MRHATLGPTEERDARPRRLVGIVLAQDPPAIIQHEGGRRLKTQKVEPVQQRYLA